MQQGRKHIQLLYNNVRTQRKRISDLNQHVADLQSQLAQAHDATENLQEQLCDTKESLQANLQNYEQELQAQRAMLKRQQEAIKVMMLMDVYTLVRDTRCTWLGAGA